MTTADDVHKRLEELLQTSQTPPQKREDVRLEITVLLALEIHELTCAVKDLRETMKASAGMK